MLAPFRIFDGTAAAPGLAFLNDTDNGIWRIGPDNWALVSAADNVAEIFPDMFTIPSGVVLNVLGTVSGNVLDEATADLLYIQLTEKAAPLGVATLDAGGLVPASQLPPIPAGAKQSDAPPALVKGELWFDSDSGNFSLAYENPDATLTFVGVNAVGGDYIASSQKAAASGVASLGADSRLAQGSLRTLPTQNLAGQQFVDFAIPAGVRKIVVGLNYGNSPSGEVGLRIGAVTPDTTGYLGGSMSVGATNLGTAWSTSVPWTSNGSTQSYGAMTLSLVDELTNTWAITGNLGTTVTIHFAGGIKALNAALGILRFGNFGGQVFSSGSISLQYQG
jgi:hypothetical protein